MPVLTLLDKINQLEFLIGEREELLKAFNLLFEIASANLAENEKVILRHDLDHFYYNEGRLLVLKTFAGGIIFLREPEVINKIEILFRSELNEATASVEYASEKRNARNVKYKPNAGQIESMKWNMELIFPNLTSIQKTSKSY